MQAEVDGANVRARDAQSALDEIKARDAENTKRVQELMRDTTVLGGSMRQMTTQYAKINNLNNELLDKYNKLLAGDRSENRKLLTDLEALRLDLMNKEDSVNALAKRASNAIIAATRSRSMRSTCRRRADRTA